MLRLFRGVDGNMLLFLFHIIQGSLQNVKLVFNKEIEDLMNSTTCSSPSAPVFLDDDDEQQFSAGKL